MRIWQDEITLEKFSAVERATAVEHCGLVLTELGDDFLSGMLTVTAAVQQLDGTLHGGGSAVLAESLASLAANGVVDRSRFACLGQQINLAHLKPVPFGDTIKGTARPLGMDQHTQVWGVDIVNNSGELVCVSRVMMAVVPRPANAKAFLNGLSAS
ncbi:MAG TPA: hotdog fold thioesterase [Steroidobacteraceae bacterium]|nr:hotdog fold thioesterase [Steroidobacteraceae bacterium]HRX88881.1 hotdog fold thioesterase [Steroidobacteraceae bacterium]